MASLRLYVTRPLAADPALLAGPGIDVDVFPDDRPPTRDELIAGARGAAGLVCTFTERIDAAVLDALPTLRVVAAHAVGVDNIDLPACAARGIRVTNTPDVLTDATADLTLALLLAVARRVREGERLVREGRFHGWSPTMLLGLELRGAQLGIFGYGRIGRAVAERARAFGMRIACTSRSPAGDADARQVVLDELLATSDVVSLHAPLTAETRHVLGASQLAQMKRGALLINTARGPLVDEQALARALESGHLGGAGLDVYEEEPHVHTALLDRDDVVLLPHLGSATVAARRRMAEVAIGEAARVLRGEEPRHPVHAKGTER